MFESVSTPSTKTTGRPPVKQRAIVEMLHRQIIDGVLPPGAQLPTRRNLVAQFGGSFLSVQQALDQLVRERFVEARGAAGTFVSLRPPHLHEYALVFEQSPGDPGFRRFWAALGNEAQRLNQIPDASRHITCWYGINGHADCEDFQRLVALVERRRLAGLIFANSPYLLENSSLMNQPGIPRVAITDPREKPRATTVVNLNTISFLQRAVDHLAGCHRKRIAMISVPSLSKECLDAYEKQIRKKRLATRPYWRLQIEPSMGMAARNIAHLLMNPDQKPRPDALIIADDNLVEPVTKGLIDAGVKVPRDLEIVAHCNFPWPTPSELPVHRLGFDAREVLKACLEAVDHQQQKKTMPRMITITAKFENEVSNRTHETMKSAT